MSRLEAGKVELLSEPMDIREIVQNTLSMISGRVHQSGVNIEMQASDEQDYHVKGDALRFTQVSLSLYGAVDAVLIKASDRAQPCIEFTQVQRSRLPHCPSLASLGAFIGQ